MLLTGSEKQKGGRGGADRKKGRRGDKRREEKNLQKGKRRSCPLCAHTDKERYEGEDISDMQIFSGGKAGRQGQGHVTRTKKRES